MGPNEELLKFTLAAAVPLWIEILKKRPLESIRKRAPELAQVIAEKGDVIQFKSKKKGATADAFNALAEALASLAFVTGGVRFSGMHWEAEHSEGKW